VVAAAKLQIRGICRRHHYVVALKSFALQDTAGIDP